MTNEPVDFNQEPNDVEAPPAVEQQVEMEDAKEENPPLQRTGSDRPKSPASAFMHQTDNQAYTLSWHDLDFEVEVSSGPCGAPEKKKIVKNASGVLKPGRLTAIMGPSGAGKTSMMNVLAGRAPYGQISAGQIMLNGKVADPTVYRQELAYVMQHDALFATQTPREVLTFTATLRLPDLSESEREQIVTYALEVLGLEKCADTYIGSAMIPGLSGGEKKRVAVAVELIASPSLIFLDEPTSGLDSHTAYELVSTLRSLAESGCTIVCTIHQPSSETYALFHDVIMLKSGWIAYSGKASKVGDFFEDEKNKCPNNSNPCDFAMYRLQMMSDDEVLPYVERVPKVAQPESKGVLTEADLSGHPNAGPFAQLVQLVKREVLNLVRDKASLGARCGVSIVLSLLLGCIYFKVGDEWGDDGDDTDITNKIRDHWGAIQFAAINAMFASAQPMLLAFPLERAAFIRESTVGTYSALSYVAAKTLVELPASFLQMLLQTLIFYFMVDLQGSFIFIVLALTAVSAVSTSLALLLGCATTSAETAVQLVPLVYVPQILFSGVFISTDQMPVWMSWLQWICPLKYGVALVTTAEFGAQYVPDNREAAVADLVGRNDINRDEWWVAALLTLGLFLGYRIGGTVLLWYRASKFE